MSALKWLILDANVVIYLHETGLWQAVLSRCEVYLARSVAEDEVKFYRGTEANEIIDLSDDVKQGRVRVFERTLADIKRFRDGFDPNYVDALHLGETESLDHLVQSKESYLISSGDAAVFRVLGRLNRGDQGVSLEEVLLKVGLGRGVTWPYTKRFREKYTGEGEQDFLRGRGLKKGPGP